MHRSVGVLVIALLAAVAMLPGSATAGVPHSAVVSDNPVNYTPNLRDDAVVGHTATYAFHQIGDTMYAGGAFNSVANGGQTTPSVTRDNLMSFSATTGAINSFAPSLNGEVWAIQSDATGLYVAGNFTSVNGTSRRGVVKLNPTTGAVITTFNAQLASGKVSDMHLFGGRLFIGGNFPGKLRALDPATGADTGYVNLDVTGRVADNSGPTDTYRFAVSQTPFGPRLVAIGNFTHVNGLVRERAYMLNLGATSATLNDWYYAPLVNECRAERLRAQLRGVDFSPDGSYFAMVATGWIPMTGGQGRDICDATARFDTNVANPLRPRWINYTNGDTLHSVVVTGAAVYAQGHNRWMQSAPGSTSFPAREGIGALNPSNGFLLPWNPGKTRGIGGKVLYSTAAGLWVGSDGARFAGELRDGIAFVQHP